YFDGKGPQRTGCTFCGACMTGCRVGAKNSLDKNYLHLAQSLGTTILAESEVIDVRPLDNDRGETGYRVSFRSSTRLNKKRESLTAKSVIFSGGVLGTISLLLRLKQTSLPRLSDRVGKDIRTNNETLVSVTTLDKNQDHSRGVAIGSILHSDDNSHLEIVRYAKGSGFWRLSHLPHVSGANGLIRFFKMLGVLFRSPVRYFRLFTVRDWARSTSVLLFMQTLDSTLSFRKNGLGGLSTVARTSEKPMADIPESNDLIRRYARIVGGLPTALSVQVLAGTASTAHLLGGAVMGKNANEGVIGPDNRVYGYENLWVVDGAMISANPGVNPSLSITAIAERAMDQISPKGS
ncbi:MAG: GMC oxidoreductase, partial [Cyclobacteriaceae bacterium]|nr:GMC oxidoreductase [Cyclobacteriaceae bacterium]